MVYNKHTWETQELITADKLNNMEDGIDDSIKNQPDIASGIHSIDSINNNKIANLSNIYGYMGIQETIIDPRTGYRYVISNYKNSDNTNATEDLLIVELDEFMRYRSNMKVTHGVSKTSWLHGQFTQFNYYNEDENKVVLLLGGPGESVKLEYKPFTTSKYDDLPVFFTVDEKNSYTQAVDFDNNKVFAAVMNKDTSNSTYTFNFYMYNLDPVNGNTTKIGSYSDTIDIPIGYVSQGVSAAPASSYLNRESSGTMLFLTSGVTNMGDGSYTEMSIRTYLIEDDKLIHYSTIDHLEKSGGYSTSNTTTRSSYTSVRKDVDNVVNLKYREIEGSSQVKIGDKWVFTTNLVAGNDSNWYNNKSDYSQRNMEIYQLAFGNNELIDTLKNIGKPEFNKYMGVESLVDNLYTIFTPGTYQISPTKLPDLKDAPYVLRQGSDKDTVGGTGLDSIQLDVSYQGMYGRVKQVLTLQSYSYLNNIDLTFERTVRTQFTIGQPNNYSVGMWEFRPIQAIGNWNIMPMMTKTTNMLLPGLKKFIGGAQLSSYFADDNFVPTGSGVLEVLPIALPGEGTGGATTRIVQRFTELSDVIRVYERRIIVNTENVGSTFPLGIGGGYPSYKTLGQWKELTN